MTQEEIKDTLAIYIMQFGNLNYQITIKALNNITLDEKKMKSFSQAPIPTLARESVRLTEFTEAEKRKYNNENLREAVDIWKEEMVAYNAFGKEVSRRKMTILEYDNYIGYKMSQEEYGYWKNRQKGLNPIKPDVMRYNPYTRKEDYDPITDDFEPIGVK